MPDSEGAGVVAATSLSVVSIIGMIGTCLISHKDVLLDTIRNWKSGHGEDDDIEAQRQSTIATAPTQTTPNLFPNISFPIVINNNPANSSKHVIGTVTLPSPFESKNGDDLERSHSEPTPETSDFSDVSPARRSDDHTSTSSDPVVFRILEGRHSH